MRTGQAKQHYLNNEVISFIIRKTKEAKRAKLPHGKSQSAYMNMVFMDLIAKEKLEMKPDGA